MATLNVIRRWALRDQMSIREISRRTGLARNTIKKHLRSKESEPKYPRRVYAQSTLIWFLTLFGRRAYTFSMSALPPPLCTLHQFKAQTGSTGLFAKGRGLLSIIDDELTTWNNGNCVGERKKTLVNIIAACRQWLNVKQGKTTALALQRGAAVTALAQQAFARLQYEYFEMRKRAQPNHRLRGLQGGYGHERSTYVNSGKMVAVSGSTASALIKNAPIVGIQNVPQFDNMTENEFTHLVNTYAPGQLFQTQVHFFTKQERIGRLAVVLNHQLYIGPDLLLDTNGHDWAWVMDGYGNLYTTDHHVEEGNLGQHERFNHSTLNAGKDVVCAGILQAAQGHLTYLDNASGHYRPRRKNVVEALKILKDSHYRFRTNVCEVRVMEMDNNGMQWSIFDSAQTLIDNPIAAPDQVG